MLTLKELSKQGLVLTKNEATALLPHISKISQHGHEGENEIEFVKADEDEDENDAFETDETNTDPLKSASDTVINPGAENEPKVEKTNPVPVDVKAADAEPDNLNPDGSINTESNEHPGYGKVPGYLDMTKTDPKISAEEAAKTDARKENNDVQGDVEGETTPAKRAYNRKA